MTGTGSRRSRAAAARPCARSSPAPSPASPGNSGWTGTPMSETDRLRLLCADQRRRWQEGDRPPVETYLQQQPELRADPEALLDLIYHEIVLRQESGETPQLDEYLRRFDGFAAELRMLFEVHQALGDAPAAGADAVRVPGYEVLGELGRGGMGVVYKARQLALKRLVALKVIRAGPHAGAAELARLRTEAEAVARLQHPNIVQIYEVREQDGLPCLALEFVDGGSLAERLAGTPQPPRGSAALVETLARAVHYAHERGIVHRDLKPANVLLTFSRDPAASAAPALASGSRLNGAIPKITDFGLAKLLDAESLQTPADALLGTPNYMAPEQAAGRADAVGPACDV